MSIEIKDNAIYVNNAAVAVLVAGDSPEVQAFGMLLAKLVMLDSIEARIGSATTDLVKMAKLVNHMANALDVNGAMMPKDVKGMLE